MVGKLIPNCKAAPRSFSSSSVSPPDLPFLVHGDEILASTMFSVNLAQPNQYILARDYKCINRRMIADWKCILYAFHATVRNATEGDVIHAPEIVNPDHLPLSALLRFKLQL